ncbi:MAG TPA: RlmE family RNA methyltransferase [Methylomirabilota bacterium]|nr:RlmE family RNA methyltransferase [Methylomirabilota bacterium]
MTNEWLRKRKKDQFHRLAKARGYRSRAAFKLQQIAKRYRPIRRGDVVLDLGAAPGGWLQAAHQIVGNQGYLLGVDIEPIAKLPFENIDTLEGDITDGEVLNRIISRGHNKYDVVLSDVAPNVSGVWEVDHARQIEMARCALRLACNVLKPSGNLLVKVFQGSEINDFRNEMRARFRVLRIVKPPASRAESAELYFLGLGFLESAKGT